MIEIINQKLEELAKQKEQLIANLNAISGAEQVLRELREKVTAEEQEAEQA